MILNLNQSGSTLCVYDPYIMNKKYVKNDFIFSNNLPIDGSIKFEAIIISVAHDEFKLIDINKWRYLINPNNVIYDLKGILPRELNPLRI